MKIWSVTLRLGYIYDKREGGWYTKLSIDTSDVDYVKVNDKYWEQKAYIRDSIPSKIEVRKISTVYLAECGYENQPTDEELKAIEEEMKQAIFNYIEEEFSYDLSNYKSKLRALFIGDK